MDKKKRNAMKKKMEPNTIIDVTLSDNISGTEIKVDGKTEIIGGSILLSQIGIVPFDINSDKTRFNFSKEAEINFNHFLYDSINKRPIRILLIATVRKKSHGIRIVNIHSTSTESNDLATFDQMANELS